MERASIVLTTDVVQTALDRGIARAIVPVRALGAAAGVSHQTAARWLRGEYVSPETERKLRMVLGLDPTPKLVRAPRRNARAAKAACA